MIISNLKIGTSYFFTPLQEFAKENIRYRISDVNTEREDKKNGILGDINAITSVGQSNKIDSAKIGKFGMGFKSVFQYTCSPLIYHGFSSSSKSVRG